MSRMTSDIESLSQLFQEGLVNLAVQALTLVVVTVILFTLNPDAGAHHPGRGRAGDAGA